jgi:hypothetical protein
MSAVSAPPARPALSRLAPPRPARALWLEFRRSPVPYLLPFLAAFFYYDAVRTADGYPPVWTLRASVVSHLLFSLSIVGGGLAAWTGAREGRRKTADLLATTPRAAWSRLSVALAGTLCWLLLAFLAFAAVLYIQTALQATGGGPPLWPVFVGAAAVTMSTVAGFTCGALFPGRFTAPLVTLALAVLFEIGFREELLVRATPLKHPLAPSAPPGLSAPNHPPLQVSVFHDLSYGTYALLSPMTGPPSVEAGVYHRVVPDLSIVQVMFMGGIAVALFGVLGLAAGLRGPRPAAGWLARSAAVALVACGLAASGTGFALAGTAKPDTTAGGWEIPALHSAASDRPVAAAPDCTSAGGLPVCVDPALGFDLPAVAAQLGPVAEEIAGLPGAPTRAEEVPSRNGWMAGISGNPPVFEFNTDHVDTVNTPLDGTTGLLGWRTGLPQGLLDAFLAGPKPAAGLNQAQQAVEDALLAGAGAQPVAPPGPPPPFPSPAAAQGPAVSAAARRFEALPASARHAWLAKHLAALRAGKITPARLP